jgi:hypothetical protein
MRELRPVRGINGWVVIVVRLGALVEEVADKAANSEMRHK